MKCRRAVSPAATLGGVGRVADCAYVSDDNSRDDRLDAEKVLGLNCRVGDIFSDGGTNYR
jgi:hypothetical protein